MRCLQETLLGKKDQEKLSTKNIHMVLSIVEICFFQSQSAVYYVFMWCFELFGKKLIHILSTVVICVIKVIHIFYNVQIRSGCHNLRTGNRKNHLCEWVGEFFKIMILWISIGFICIFRISGIAIFVSDTVFPRYFNTIFSGKGNV